jgi:hypothetical protein
MQKIRKRQGQYPEFGHTYGQNFKNLQKNTLTFNKGETKKTITFHGFLSFTLFFFSLTPPLFLDRFSLFLHV